MGFGKFLACVAGGVAAVATAPLWMPVAAAAGGVALAAGATVAGAASAVGGAVASTAAGAAVLSAAGTAGGALASTAAGTAVLSAAGAAASVAGTAVGAAGAAAGTALTTTVATMGAPGVAALTGAGATYAGTTVGEGFLILDEAKEVIAAATSKYDKARRLFDKHCGKTTAHMEELNALKLGVYADVIGKSVPIFQKIQTVRHSDVEFLEDRDVADMFEQRNLAALADTGTSASKVLSELKDGIGIAHGASAGTVAFVSQFGFASTGTAISTLYGAAAQKAMLAALGGGALSSGGGGMALGGAVLGGLTILPSAMFMSWRFASNAQRQLTEAHEHNARIEEEIAKIAISRKILKSIDARIDELIYVIEGLSSRYQEVLLPKLKRICKKYSDSDGRVSFAECSEPSKQGIVLAAYYIKAIKNVLQAKVLDDKNQLHEESLRIMEEVKRDPAFSEALDYA